MINIFDVEVFPNFFSVVYWDIEGNIKKRLWIYKDNNDIQQIIDVFSEDHWWVGFNSQSYDNPLIQFILDNKELFSQLDSDQLTPQLYDKSQEIIDNDFSHYINVSFKYIDLMRVCYIMKSLKLVAVDLKHPLVQDLPKPFNEEVEDDEVEEILDYNDNDVEITWKLYHHKRKEIQLRKDLSKKYKQNLMSLPDTDIANVILERDYASITGTPPQVFKKTNTQRDLVDFSECVLDKIKFNSPNLQKLLHNIKESKANKKTKIKFSTLIGNTRYDILKGGIHSNMPPAIYTSDEYITIKDADVNSVAS